MFVITDPSTLGHETIELLGGKQIPALESPDRIMACIKALENSNHIVKQIEWRGKLDNNDPLQNFLAESHDPGYLEHLQTVHKKWVQDGLIEQKDSVLPECFPVHRLFSDKQIAAKLNIPPKDVFARTGYYAFDMSTGICEKTWVAAMASANLVVQGAQMLAANLQSKEPNTIMALCRPPGHHCNTKMSGGYCYINNAVVAVQALRHYHFNGSKINNSVKIVILDLDFHHGNGTQDYFYSDPSVLFVSIHGLNEYPYYSGFDDETGEGEGNGFNVNLPLPAGSSAEEYLAKLDEAMRRIDEYEPSHLIVSLGFDTFETDPLGNFKIETEDYFTIANRVKSSSSIRGISSLLLLEGGYVVEKLGENLLAFLGGWENASNGLRDQ